MFSSLPIRGPSSLYLDVHSRREVQLHQGIQRLLGRLQNIQQPLVNPYLELLTGLLVNMGGPQHRIFVNSRGERYRAGDFRSSSPGRVYDLSRGLVKELVIVGL